MTATAADDKTKTDEATETDDTTDESEPISKQKTRPYHVLVAKDARIVHVSDSGDSTEVETTGVYVEVGTYTTATSKEAVTLAAGEHGPDNYVAVADSAWNEHSATLKRVEPQLVIQ